MNKAKEISVSQLKDFLNSDDAYCVIDTRTATEFTDGFIPGSVFVGKDGNFVEWMLSLFEPGAKIILVTPAGEEQHFVTALSDAGFKNIEGYLEGGFDAWKKAGEAVDMIINVDAAEMAMDMPFD